MPAKEEIHFFISLFPSHRRVCLQKPLKFTFFSLHFLTMQWEDNIETRCGVRQPRPGKYSFQIGFPIFFLSAGLYSYTERRNFGEGMAACHTLETIKCIRGEPSAHQINSTSRKAALGWILWHMPLSLRLLPWPHESYSFLIWFTLATCTYSITGN